MERQSHTVGKVGKNKQVEKPNKLRVRSERKY